MSSPDNDGSTLTVEKRTSSFKNLFKSAPTEETLLRERLDSALLSEFSHSMRYASEERRKELKEQREVKRFGWRLKFCAYFFIFFSCFILMNACIGFSSAPFYLPGLDCSALEPTPDCLALSKSASALYTVEAIGALLMVVHGLLLIGAVDHIKSLRLLTFLQRYTKVVILLYGVLILLRIGLYFRVRQDMLPHDRYKSDQGFGNFLASYIASDP